MFYKLFLTATLMLTFSSEAMATCKILSKDSYGSESSSYIVGYYSNGKILSRNRFERYVMAGGFEGVGRYLAKNYKLNNLKDINNIVEVGPNIGELSLWLINSYLPKKI